MLTVKKVLAVGWALLEFDAIGARAIPKEQAMLMSATPIEIKMRIFLSRIDPKIRKSLFYVQKPAVFARKKVNPFTLQDKFSWPGMPGEKIPHHIGRRDLAGQRGDGPGVLAIQDGV
jgi:hypothetical protein